MKYLLSLREEGISVVAICQPRCSGCHFVPQYNVARSTFYYWLSRYELYSTYENLSRAPHQTHSKVTESIKSVGEVISRLAGSREAGSAKPSRASGPPCGEVINQHKKNPRLGCWRLSLFSYDDVQLSSVTIWHILNENKKPKDPPEILYTITHFHHIWFIDHMHLRTLKNGQKVYTLLIVSRLAGSREAGDGMSRVLLSDEICLNKGARDACLILLRTFPAGRDDFADMRWGLPDEIVSDNAKAFTSFLYRKQARKPPH